MIGVVGFDDSGTARYLCLLELLCLLERPIEACDVNAIPNYRRLVFKLL